MSQMPANDFVHLQVLSMIPTATVSPLRRKTNRPRALHSPKSSTHSFSINLISTVAVHPPVTTLGFGTIFPFFLSTLDMILLITAGVSRQCMCSRSCDPRMRGTVNSSMIMIFARNFFFISGRRPGAASLRIFPTVIRAMSIPARMSSTESPAMATFRRSWSIFSEATDSEVDDAVPISTDPCSMRLTVATSPTGKTHTLSPTLATP
mmetsp:Transcript_12945/g.19407  ORF Transcript_12945/g.19407 Transcript_12945/m.19407 type:complete len:207 (-) Transcript_12945:1960-2580(-)